MAWFFPTGDAVTATPTVVNGTVYVGSWDDYFYALDLETGAVRWKYKLSAQNAITPYPGQQPRDATSDGGLVTSSAWYQPGAGTRPDLVIFGGGYTLYALNADTGSLYWSHDYTGRPEQPPNPNQDGTRIFSSPVVADGNVLFGVDVDGQKNSRGYVVAASVDTGDPVWEFQTDVGPTGQVLNDGCGSVWSSGTLLPGAGLVVFDTADCDFSNSQSLSEAVFALHVDSGKLAWVESPATSRTRLRLGLRRHRQCRDHAGWASHLPRGGRKRRHLLLVEPDHRKNPVVDQRRLRRILGRVHRYHCIRRTTGLRVDCPRAILAVSKRTARFCATRATLETPPSRSRRFMPSTPPPARSNGRPTTLPRSLPPPWPTA